MDWLPHPQLHETHNVINRGLSTHSSGSELLSQRSKSILQGAQPFPFSLPSLLSLPSLPLSLPPLSPFLIPSFLPSFHIVEFKVTAHLLMKQWDRVGYSADSSLSLFPISPQHSILQTGSWNLSSCDCFPSNAFILCLFLAHYSDCSFVFLYYFLTQAISCSLTTLAIIYLPITPKSLSN